MKRILLLSLAILALASACKQNDASKSNQKNTSQANPPVDTFQWSTESFSDKKIIRYQVPSFEKLSLQQKKLVYYLTEAGYVGRDIIWDQNYRHNLAIRRSIEKIIKNFQGNRSSDDWKAFTLYAKNVWFSSGIHHHYSNDKFIPGFSKEYFISLLGSVGTRLSDEALRAMFDAEYDAKRVMQNPEDLLKYSAVNFYDRGITEREVDEFYAAKKATLKDPRVSMGLNSKVVRNTRGELEERVWKVGGMYGKAIERIVFWLEKAVEVAENKKQGDALKLLIEYYKTGDLVKWDEYNIAWTQATEGDIDYINSFIEVYHDPKGYKGSYESIVQITDFDASKRMKTVAENAQWFETHSPILDAHKKKDVTGISYKVVAVAGESGDASPSTAIGVNLPNAEWIRADYGSKSVSLGNIIEAYSKADGPGLLNEFSHDYEEKERARKYGDLASKLHTALHEVIGHASGQLEEGVATPAETLKNYASALEEARADLVALYYILDQKLVQMGLVESLEVGKASYDSYIKNGLMLQLRRIEPGKSIEQAHMRNRQTVASWAFEKSQAENVISKVTRDGKTYFEINDYDKLRAIFGELLREVQRIKSQGDYEAGKNLIENYGVKVDAQIHAEVLRRSKPLNIPPYGGFINPRFVPVTGTDGEITDIRVEYPNDFMQQMLEYGEKYSLLPDYN